jgi:hypothetical protein
MRLVRKFGEMWARNLENINRIPPPKQGGTGVYILYDGSMPVYVGKGHIRHRIDGARRSKAKQNKRPTMGPFQLVHHKKRGSDARH